MRSSPSATVRYRPAQTKSGSVQLILIVLHHRLHQHSTPSAGGRRVRHHISPRARVSVECQWTPLTLHCTVIYSIMPAALICTYCRLTDSEMDLFHCMQFSDSDSDPVHAWAELSAGATLSWALAPRVSCMQRSIDCMSLECMSDSANLSGAAWSPGLPGTKRGTVQPLSPPEC